MLSFIRCDRSGKPFERERELFLSPRDEHTAHGLVFTLDACPSVNFPFNVLRNGSLGSRIDRPSIQYKPRSRSRPAYAAQQIYSGRACTHTPVAVGRLIIH